MRTEDIACTTGASNGGDVPVRLASDRQEQCGSEEYCDRVREHQWHGAVLCDNPGRKGRAGDHADAVGEVLPCQGAKGDPRADAVPEVGEESPGGRTPHCRGRPDEEATDAQVHHGQNAENRGDGDDEVTKRLDGKHEGEGAAGRQPVPKPGCPPRRGEKGDAGRAGHQSGCPHRARLLEGDEGQRDLGHPKAGPAHEDREQDAGHISLHPTSIGESASSR